jgi:hypothetical protein
MADQLSFDQMTWSINPYVSQISSVKCLSAKWQSAKRSGTISIVGIQDDWRGMKGVKVEGGEGASGVSICDVDCEN